MAATPLHRFRDRNSRHSNYLQTFSHERRNWELFVSADRIVAVGLLTKRDVQLLGPTFDRLWPVEETPCFSQLLQAIDEADREVWRERDGSGGGEGS